MKRLSYEFQSTPPCGGDQAWRNRRNPVWYFNPRPLAGATKIRGLSEFTRAISIHAPLRGRPGNPQERTAARHISIHAPLRGRPYGHFG